MQELYAHSFKIQASKTVLNYVQRKKPNLQLGERRPYRKLLTNFELCRSHCSLQYSSAWVQARMIRKAHTLNFIATILTCLHMCLEQIA